MNNKKHKARVEAGFAGEAVTGGETSPGKNSTAIDQAQPATLAIPTKRALVWLGVHGLLPVGVTCWLIQALRLAGV